MYGHFPFSFTFQFSCGQLCGCTENGMSTFCKFKQHILRNMRLCSSGSSRLSPSGFEAHPGANTFPSVRGLTTTSFTDPSASRNTFPVSTIMDGNAQAGAAVHFPPFRWPDCTLSRLRAEEYDRPVTQSIATPEPFSRTIPTLDRTLVAR